jgi:hypothetical protein
MCRPSSNQKGFVSQCKNLFASAKNCICSPPKSIARTKVNSSDVCPSRLREAYRQTPQITARILSSKVYDLIPGLCAAKSRNSPNISYLNNQKCPQILAQRSPISDAPSAQNLDIVCAFRQAFANSPNQLFLRLSSSPLLTCENSPENA